VLFSVLAGIALSVLWSYEFVDSVIGDNVANTLLGHDAKATAIGGTAAGLLFAFVSGLAGTFTACNIAMAASVGPMAQADARGTGDHGARGTVRAVLRPVKLLTLGMLAVSVAYGFIGVLIGERLPQVSTDIVGHMPVRIIQSSVVFGVIGLALTYLGLAALGVLPDVFARRPALRVFTMGALVGGFLVGRPYPLFNKLFHWAIETGNPLYGGLSFALQSLGNIVIVTVLFALLVLATRGRFLQWLRSGSRATVVTGTLLIALGVFTVVYWDLRVPAIFGVGWFPSLPYN
jgi:cytochrome c biogenesis protein CcdA